MNIRYLRKILNYKLVEYQKSRGHRIVFGHPYWLTIDPSSVCGLQCVFCPTGQRRGTRTPEILPFGSFVKIIKKLGPYLLHVDFCNWGEPLMNKELARMIAFAKQYGVTTKIDTNLNVRLSADDARELIMSGLDTINASIDGASQKTYELYRRGGNFEQAIENLRLLVRTREQLGRKKPVLHWQFLVFRHNEHEIAAARAMAAAVGVDSIGFTAPFCGPEWVSTKDEYNNYRQQDNGMELKKVDRLCAWLWDGITINANGSVSPCCSVEDAKDDFGDFFSRPFFFLWNNAYYRSARRFVAGRARQGTRENVCVRCDHIGASNHRKIELINIGRG
jgi:MoaA/NifB/PqqE/SkfB family radical SAM enzyme